VTKPVVPIEKVRDYLLKLDHPDGGPKAAFFIAGGYTPDRPEELASALTRHFMDNPPANKTPDRFGGMRVTIEATLITPNGRAPKVRSVWTIDEGETAPRLITAYPAG